ncbi:peptidylprolyl isomerase [Polynucleobacter sp. JS-JIR-II-b4]|uniref:peptidylprolyl isomerase n=1 Tax=Polynucleobacter sp. JS-JIR-II-b4 TaxID=1758390 RepID=UPI00203A4366|nr:peptidylprolyl isomerase [Polynucleobacter sp. JS-JIR-II-b4]
MKRFKQMSVHAIFIGIGLFANVAFAQDSAKANAMAESKIRNIDGVAAVVNTGYVTRKEIDDRIAALKKQGVKLPEDGSVRKIILERLILEKIQLQNADQEGVRVTNKELDKIISDIAAKNKLSYAEFKAKVIASGSTFERYKETLRDDVIVTRYREREVEGKLKISDAEIDNFIAERTRAMTSGGAQRSAPAAKGELEEIDVAQIFIPVDAGAGAGAQADAKKKADDLLKDARGDIDFLQLGTMAAKDNPKIKFQELGYRTPDRLPQLFYEAIRNTGGGQVANSVVKSPAGYHVLKVLDRRAAGVSAPPQQAAAPDAGSPTPKNIPITQTLPRHILLRSRAGLSDQDAERRLQGYRDQIRAKTADFAELAKKYSEDGSAPNGGELGWMSPGDLVPEFEQAMNRLQIGEVSNPVKSEFGWHLIQVLERREGQLTVEKQRQFARAAIREKKFDQAYQEWMRELRDNATVKILNVEDEASSAPR